jgi:hypothetical protein
MEIKKKVVGLCAITMLTLSLSIAYAETAPLHTIPHLKKEATASNKPVMKLYIDTHDKGNGTFPVSITSKQLNTFYASYAKACAEEGVVIIRTYVSQKDGKAFCVNMAPSVTAIKKAHDKAGLPYSNISEVNGVAPTDLLLNEK